jgi:thiamine pyrophosphokinase
MLRSYVLQKMKNTHEHNWVLNNDHTPYVTSGVVSNEKLRFMIMVQTALVLLVLKYIHKYC